jgi:glycosyltransferase involved in cell wall biosynthesis
MEMFTITAIHQLQKRGHEVELLCYRDGKIHRQASEEGIITHPVKAKGYFHPIVSWKLAKLISDKEFDLIHTQASKDLWVLVPAKKLSLTDIPLILTKQVGSFIVKKDLFHKFIYSNVTYALAISEVIRKNLLDTCPLKESQILLLHNGIDTQRFNPKLFNKSVSRAEFGFKEDEIVIGMMARFSPGKGHEEFLKALSILTKKYAHIRGLIVGEASRGEDAYANSIKQLAGELKLSNIVFAGFRKDTDRVFSAMDIFAFPSHSEAFGISLVEAMSMGVPSVCSNSDGVLDIAVDNETGYFFRKQNTVDLADKLEMLIISPEKRKAFGENARKRAENYFDLEYLTEKVLAIYNQVTPRRKK